jgi:hypothetical protein
MTAGHCCTNLLTAAAATTRVCSNRSAKSQQCGYELAPCLPSHLSRTAQLILNTFYIWKPVKKFVDTFQEITRKIGQQQRTPHMMTYTGWRALSRCMRRGFYSSPLLTLRIASNCTVIRRSSWMRALARSMWSWMRDVEGHPNRASSDTLVLPDLNVSTHP